MKLYEFINNDNKELIVSLLDRFIFFDNIWLFPSGSESEDYIRNILPPEIDFENFMIIGNNISSKLNDNDIQFDSDLVDLIKQIVTKEG